MGLETSLKSNLKYKRRCLVYCAGRVSGIFFMRYAHSQNIGKPNNLKVFGRGGEGGGAIIPMGLNLIPKTDYGYICLTQ